MQELVYYSITEFCALKSLFTFYRDLMQNFYSQFQVTKSEYENAKLTGAETALLDLLQAILVDRKMPAKEKIKKIRKFKESYPHLWR